jgi:hypothetical protein
MFVSRTITLPLTPPVVIELGTPDGPGAYDGGIINGLNDSDSEDNIALFTALEAVESLVLAHACSGVDVQNPAYIKRLESSLAKIRRIHEW